MITLKHVMLLFFGVATGVALLRLYFRNQRVTNATGGLLEALERNELGFDEVAAELGMRIRERPAPAMTGTLESLDWEHFHNQTIHEKFTVLKVLKKENHGVIFIATGKAADFVPSYGSGREVSKAYPCLLHIRHLQPENTLFCTSSMPADKDHQHLLEDMADFLLDTIKPGAAVV